MPLQCPYVTVRPELPRPPFAEPLAKGGAAHPHVRPGLIARDGAAATAHGQQALVGEPAIRPRDGIPMHTEVSGQLPHGGQILAGANAPLGNRLAQAPGNLVLERPGVVEVDPYHALTVSDNDTVVKRGGASDHLEAASCYRTATNLLNAVTDGSRT